MPDLSTIPDQTLAELVISGIHADEDIAVDNLQVGTPPGGWTATVTRADGDFIATFDGMGYREEPVEYARDVFKVDAATDEQLVLLAVRAIYEQSNWKVTGISNLQIGVPEGGLTVDIDMRNPDTRATVKARGVYLNGIFEDELLEGTEGEDRGDEWREDAPKGKGKGRSGGRNCNKGRPCGNSCIAQSKKCRIQAKGAPKEALEQVSSKGRPKREPKARGGQQLTPDAKATADSLKGASTAIVKYTGGQSPNPVPQGGNRHFTNDPDPGTKKMTTKELQQGLFEYFDVKNVAQLRKSGSFRMATNGMDIDIRDNASIRQLYRKLVGTPSDETNPPPGPAVINGVNVMRNFLPWQALGFTTRESRMNATRADLKSAYRKAVVGRHPDQGGDREIFERIHQMYKSLDAGFEVETKTKPKKGRRR